MYDISTESDIAIYHNNNNNNDDDDDEFNTRFFFR